jgi:hypothetical protein
MHYGLAFSWPYNLLSDKVLRITVYSCANAPAGPHSATPTGETLSTATTSFSPWRATRPSKDHRITPASPDRASAKISASALLPPQGLRIHRVQARRHPGQRTVKHLALNGHLGIFLGMRPLIFLQGQRVLLWVKLSKEWAPSLQTSEMSAGPPQFIVPGIVAFRRIFGLQLQRFA